MTNDVTADLLEVETTWDPTRRDIRRAIVLVLGKGKYYALAGVVIALGVLATALGITTNSDGWSIPLLWLPMAVVFAVAFVLVPQFAGWQAWKVSPFVQARQHLRLDTTGVTTTTELTSSQLKWAALTVAYETDHFFAVATKAGSGAAVIVVPKDELSHGEYVTARALIQENVGSIR